MARFEPTRLRVARHRRSLTLKALAEATDLTTRSLSAYEHGDTQPTDETVARLAGVLRFPVAFFFAQPLIEPTEQDASFRSLASMSAGRRDAALSAGAIAFELATWIGRHFRLPKPDLPDLRASGHPELAAAALRGAWGLGTGPIRNMLDLLEQHGVRVFSLAETASDVDAFSLWHEGIPYVFLNMVKSAEHARMDAAHELGHLILRHERQHVSTEEDEAQTFGAAFLLPRERLLASVPAAPSLDALVPHKKNWGVSLAAFVYQAHRVGVLTDWQYRTLFVELSKRGFRKREPLGLPRETSQVLGQVLKLLRDRGRTIRDVAAELLLDPSDVEGLVFNLTLVSVDGGGGGGPGRRRPPLRQV